MIHRIEETSGNVTTIHVGDTTIVVWTNTGGSCFQDVRITIKGPNQPVDMKFIPMPKKRQRRVKP